MFVTGVGVTNCITIFTITEKKKWLYESKREKKSTNKGRVKASINYVVPGIDTGININSKHRFKTSVTSMN